MHAASTVGSCAEGRRNAGVVVEVTLVAEDAGEDARYDTLYHEVFALPHQTAWLSPEPN